MHSSYGQQRTENNKWAVTCLLQLFIKHLLSEMFGLCFKYLVYLLIYMIYRIHFHDNWFAKNMYIFQQTEACLFIHFCKLSVSYIRDTYISALNDMYITSIIVQTITTVCAPCYIVFVSSNLGQCSQNF